MAATSYGLGWRMARTRGWVCAVHRLRVLLGAALAAAVLLPASPGQAAAPTPAPASTGYVVAGTPARVIRRDAHALSTLGVDGVALDSDGASTTAPGADLTRLLGLAHANGLRAELLVSNYNDEQGDFDSHAGARLLRDPAKVQAVAAQLAGYVAAQGWDGVQVDLESLAADDGAGLTSFVQALQADMSPERSVSIAVMASTTAPAYAARGYQLAALGGAVDTLTLMTYDQHGPGWSAPGPVGAQAWQHRALRVVLADVPAAEVDLGVAGYGYTWPPARSGHLGRTVTDAQARRLVLHAGARARWHRGVGEWSAHLPDGTVMWWSDGRSYRLRVATATQDGLHGVSVWRLGSMDAL